MSSPPPPNTVQRWAWDYVTSTSLTYKLAPPPPPTRWENDPPARRIPAPGRPPELSPIGPRRTRRRGKLHHPEQRAELVHTFFHHELQASELMCWALLAFPEAEREFQLGILHELDDEIRHANLYAAHLVNLGYQVGSFGVRDWFWERIPAAKTGLEFIAILGVGFEGGNLDHAALYAKKFREHGDEEGARIQEEICADEIAHVRFALKWFERWGGPLSLERLADSLPAPLTPMVMRGRHINRAARERAGMSTSFLDALEAFERD